MQTMQTMPFFVENITGDYKWRQLHTNAHHFDIYVEYHFNYYSRSTDYTLCKLTRTYLPLSLEFAKQHAEAVHKEFNVPLYDLGDEDTVAKGVLICKKTGRENFNLSLLECPALIIEPLFLSNPDHVFLLTTSNGVMRLANILTNTIRSIFPDGGRIAFSVGHKYQRSNPMDRGALAVGRSELSEADLSDKIMTISQMQLQHNLEI